MTKKLICLLFVLSIAFSLCSCEGNSQESAAQYYTTAQATSETNEPETTAPAATASEDDDKYDEYIEGMTVEEKVGQMFLVRCPESGAAEMAQKYHLGGYILFGRDFEGKTKEQVISDISSYSSVQDINMLTATDEEGGTVVRVSSNPNLRSEPFKSPSDTFYDGGWSAVEQDAEEKAELLLSLGINVNMAPVCDVTSDPKAFMYYRSFSSDAERQSQFVEKTVSISRQKGLGTVLKHFPGYGNCEDTHTGIAYDDREYSQFEENDFIPFERGIASKADCILVSHNIVKCMDADMPASLSEKVHKIIREDLGFDGVIMTDDLIMEAITDFTGSKAAAVTAAKCGNDMLCCSDPDSQYPAVVNAVKSGEISEESVDDSVKRILKWKNNLGIFEP